MTKLSIIFVNYKSEENLIGSISSIISSKLDRDYEIIVVDNSPKDKVSDELKKASKKKIKYIKSDKNLGYGAGNNLGAKIAKGEYFLFLNPDTKVKKGAIERLAEFLEKNKKTAVVAPNLIDKSGKVFSQLGSARLTPIRGIIALSFLNKLFPNNPISRDYWLKDLEKNKKREVAAVPGSAFMIRKEAFEKVGGFDENFFLYFEESDLGKRLQDAGWKLFITPETEVVHFWDGSKQSDKKLKKHFEESRFYYFKKHYGTLSALVVEGFARFSKWHVALLAILGLGTFLRFFRIEQNLIFHGELGHNYLAIKNFYESGKIPLLGPPTSHPWLSFGPLYYWIFGPILILANFNPLSGAYFFAIAGVLVIVLNYFIVDKFANEKVALLSSFLVATSPAFITLTRGSRFFSLSVLFFYLFLLYLLKAFKDNPKYLFWSGLFFGIMLNFHYTPVILLPAVAMLILLNRNKFSKKGISKGFLGILIPNTPFILASAKQGFSMLFKFFVWFPYRIAGFFGIIPKNEATQEVLLANTFSLYDFVTGGFLFRASILSNLIFMVFLIFVLYLAYKFMKKRKINLENVLILFFLWGYLAIFLHGNPPNHYFLPLFTIPIILISVLAIRLFDKSRVFKIGSVVLLIFIIYSNSNYLFSEKWFYRPQNEIVRNLVPYKLQLEAAQEIVDDAQEVEYRLERVGPLDYHEGDYAQNYQYLLWWKGNEPNAKIDYNLVYTIYENEPIPDGGEIIFNKDGLIVNKTER